MSNRKEVIFDVSNGREGIFVDRMSNNIQKPINFELLHKKQVLLQMREVVQLNGD